METAEIAINASLTGHMVFSTLHTNDAPSAVSRLIDMGVKPFLVSSSLRAALAQRLVRSICQNCKQPYQPSQSELSVLGLTAEQAEGASFMRGEGCPKCGDKGYRGRKGVFEIFVVNQELEEMIYNNVSIVELRKKPGNGYAIHARGWIPKSDGRCNNFGRGAYGYNRGGIESCFLLITILPFVTFSGKLREFLSMGLRNCLIRMWWKVDALMPKH